jgi:RNA polymerase sigma-70 factor (ECF subfamily)
MNREITREPTLPQEDAALVKAFQAGNKASFDELVLRHKDRLFNLCFRFLGDYQEANDSAQEVFVKIYRSLKGFRLESAFSTWLYRIAVNTCKNKLKSSEYRHKKKMVHLDNPGILEGSTGALEITDDTQSPLLELERKERLNLIRQAIDSLPPARKMIVVLRDIEELSYEDIANITGYSLGTIKSRLSRARLDLRRKLVKVI